MSSMPTRVPGAYFAKPPRIWREAAPEAPARPCGSNTRPEFALAGHLTKFDFVLSAVAEEYRPNYLLHLSV